MQTGSTTCKWGGFGGLSALLAFTAPFLVYYYPTLPYGTFWTSILVAIPMALVFITAISIFIVSLIGLVFRRFRRNAARVLIAAFVVLAPMFMGLRWSRQLRMNEFRAFALRSESLVQHIKEFEQDTGHPPQTLSALVPQYVTEIPSTQMGAYPNYQYYLANEGPYDWIGNPWVLFVYAPCFGAFDKFLFLPNHNYPDVGFGGPIERVEDWAYVHE
ncbi:MAG: hypothetical protein WDZ59_07925 [Pirellulales bacterium]